MNENLRTEFCSDPLDCVAPNFAARYINDMPQLKSYLKSRRGLAADLAQKLGVSQATVSEWADGKKTPSPQNAVAIELATEGSVPRKTLRPNDWHLIWPEPSRPARISAKKRDAAIKAKGVA